MKTAVTFTTTRIDGEFMFWSTGVRAECHRVWGQTRRKFVKLKNVFFLLLLFLFRWLFLHFFVSLAPPFFGQTLALYRHFKCFTVKITFPLPKVGVAVWKFRNFVTYRNCEIRNMHCYSYLNHYSAHNLPLHYNIHRVPLNSMLVK